MRQEAIRKLQLDCFARKHQGLIEKLRTSPKYLGRARALVAVHEDDERFLNRFRIDDQIIDLVAEARVRSIDLRGLLGSVISTD
jgi:hypothetical protein